MVVTAQGEEGRLGTLGIGSSKDKRRLLAGQNNHGHQESLMVRTRLTALCHPNQSLRSPLVIKAVGTQGWLWDSEGSVWLLRGATVEAGNAAAALGD